MGFLSIIGALIVLVSVSNLWDSYFRREELDEHTCLCEHRKCPSRTNQKRQEF